MEMQDSQSWKLFGCILLILACAGIAGAETASAGTVSPEARAERILQSTAVKGGLVVHLGCGDGRLTAALRADERFVVQGLTADSDDVQEARRYVRSCGLYGPVSVRHWSHGRLPYVDNMVNLVVAEEPAGMPVKEIMRVLAPGGVACVKRDDKWVSRRKPWPEEIDEWTHLLHDATNNAVASDQRVDRPFHLQWVGKPRQGRHHEHMASLSAAVSANGRIFSIEDRAPVASILFPPRWHLVARDAFNGVVLWKRDIPSWHPHLWKFRQGPPQLGRRLVAVGERVYATLGAHAPVSCLDAATGETLKTYAGTEGTEEIVWHDRDLFLMVAPPDEAAARKATERRVTEYLQKLPDWATRHRGDPWDMSQPSDVARPVNLQDVSFRDGVMSFVADRDSQLNLDLGSKKLDGSYDLLVVRMYSSKRESGQVYYWSPDGDWQGFALPSVQEGWHTYHVDLNEAATFGPGGGSAERKKWGGAGGTIRRFRFDPVSRAGTQVKVDWIRLLRANNEDTERLDALTAGRKDLVVLDAETGRLRWRRTLREPMSCTLAAADGRVFYQTSEVVACADIETGQKLWSYDRPVPTNRPDWSSPTLVAQDGVVLSADRDPELEWKDELDTENVIARRLRKRYPPGRLVALSAADGEELWSCRCAEGYHAQIDVFVRDGLVWVGTTAGRHLPDFTEGRDLHTGEVKKRIDTAGAYPEKHHHRCYRNRATSRFILGGRTGVEFINLDSGDCMRHDWVRGTCQFGILPCNGLLYAPPHSCACYIQSKLNGFCALAPKDTERSRPEKIDPADRLERGPAYDAGVAGRSSGSSPEDEWPTYRRDPARTGRTEARVPTELTRRWTAELAGAVTPPVVAGGKVLVAETDAHTVHALNADDGGRLWSYTAGGRVDSPPTLWRGRVLFGCADGSVYCLRADDGKLVWRFRAAPAERWLTAFGRVESAWPVHGSVLVQDGQVYFCAGRSSYLDGGVHLYRLDAATGRELAHEKMYSRHPETGAQRESLIHQMNMGGAKPDIMSSDGESVFMRHIRLDKKTLERREQFQEYFQVEQGWRQRHQTGHPLYQNPERGPHLFSPTGFLDASWWHRSYWMYGTFFESCCPFMRAAEWTPAGRIVSLDDSTAYGYGRRPKFWGWWTPLEYHLFAAPKNTKPTSLRDRRRRRPEDWQGVILLGPYGTRVPFTWSRQVPFHVRAMVMAGDVLFAAGPPDVLDETKVDVGELMYSDELARKRLDEHLAAWNGSRNAVLWAVSAQDGSTLKKIRLRSLPVFDGMAAAQGRLYMSTRDGTVLCLGGQQ